MSSSVPIILLNGKKSSGKSTVAKYIKSRIPGTIELTLAEPLKEACKSIFLLSTEQVYDENLKEILDERWGVTPRNLLQKVGDMFRDELSGLKLSNTIFVENILKRIERINSNDFRPPLLVISDVRLDDEFCVLTKLSAMSIKIIRTTGLNDEHKTENANLNCTYSVENNGTLNELYEKVDIVLSNLHIQND